MRQSTWSLLCLGLGLGLALGWSSGKRQMAAQRMDVREELFQAMSGNRALMQECFDNMTHQFTPGYKCTQVLLDPNLPTLSMEQGKIFRTQTSSHLAINGRAFFVLSHQGETRYTRDGRFTFQNGTLKNEEKSSVMGYRIDAAGNVGQTPEAITLPLESETKLYAGRYLNFHFDEDGTLYGQQSEGGDTPLFKVALAAFETPERLARATATSFRATDEANLFREGVAGQWDLGRVAPASLEMSNVDLMEQGVTIAALRQQAGLLYGDPQRLYSETARPHTCTPGWQSSAPQPGMMMTSPSSVLAPPSLPLEPLKMELDSKTRSNPPGMFNSMMTR